MQYRRAKYGLSVRRASFSTGCSVAGQVGAVACSLLAQRPTGPNPLFYLVVGVVGSENPRVHKGFSGGELSG